MEKPISYALAIILVAAMAWVFVIAPPCEGNYELQIGGEEYFLFKCKQPDLGPGTDRENVVISIPGTAEIFGGDLIINASIGSTTHRVSLVVSSPSEGQLGGWTMSRGNELGVTSTEEFTYKKKQLFIHVKELSATQVTVVIGEK